MTRNKEFTNSSLMFLQRKESIPNIFEKEVGRGYKQRWHGWTELQQQPCSQEVRTMLVQQLEETKQTGVRLGLICDPKQEPPLAASSLPPGSAQTRGSPYPRESPSLLGEAYVRSPGYGELCSPQTKKMNVNDYSNQTKYVGIIAHYKTKLVVNQQKKDKNNYIEFKIFY